MSDFPQTADVPRSAEAAHLLVQVASRVHRFGQVRTDDLDLPGRITRCAAAATLFNEATRLTDAVWLGREPEQVEEDVYTAAQVLVDQTRRELADHPVVNPSDALIKLRALRGSDGLWRSDEDETQAADALERDLEAMAEVPRSADLARWDAAMRLYEHAAALSQQADHAEDNGEPMPNGEDPASGDIASEYWNRMSDAERILIDLPAPHLGALLFKLQALIKVDLCLGEDPNDPETISVRLAQSYYSDLVPARLYQDIHRLAGLESSVITALPYDASVVLAAMDCRLNRPVKSSEFDSICEYKGRAVGAREYWSTLSNRQQELALGLVRDREAQPDAAGRRQKAA